MSSKAPEIDPVTGVETTGHEWDGIKELNKPLPRWWLWTFYATIVWAIAYWIAYPAWPTSTAYTKGVFGYSQRDVVAKDIAAAQSAQTLYREKLKGTPLAEIRGDPDLYRFAISAGGAAFQNNCAPCHGRGAQGFIGYPNLNDDDWLWGGSLEDIERSIRFGIRSDNNETRSAQMPRFGLDQLLSDKEIGDVVEYVLSLSGKSQAREAIARGEKTFAEQCSSCHGGDGKGKAELGAPDLTDAIWLYGDSRQAVSESVRTGRGAMMPAWAGRLDAATLKALALYVHGLGGGK